MFDDPKGPIEHFSWGKFIICGKEHSKLDEKIGVGKDIRLIGKKKSQNGKKERVMSLHLQ
jgi:hypothetical protein